MHTQCNKLQCSLKGKFSLSLKWKSIYVSIMINNENAHPSTKRLSYYEEGT
jgi:hypothetical protein